MFANSQLSTPNSTLIIERSDYMDGYSLPRRIWRIIYPVLIFIVMQLFFAVFVGIGAAVVLAVQEALSGASALDEMALVDGTMQFITENTIIVLLVTNIASFAVFLPMWLKTRGRNEPCNNKNPATLLFLIAGFFIGFNVVQMLIFGLTDITRFFPSYEDVAESLSSGSIAMQVIAVGIAAPIVEELLFRGILINRMKWLPVWAAVVIQALLFSAVHMNWFQSLYAFLAGILLGLVYIKFRSIAAVITGHIAFNLSSVLLGEFLSEESAVIVLLLSPVLMVVCAILLIKRVGAVNKYAVPPDIDLMPWL